MLEIFCPGADGIQEVCGLIPLISIKKTHESPVLSWVFWFLHTCTVSRKTYLTGVLAGRPLCLVNP